MNGKEKDNQMAANAKNEDIEANDNNVSTGPIKANQPAGDMVPLAADEPRKLIPELCNHFYHLGWASGTGGGLSIRQSGRIYCAPSGVQKERIKPEDMFVLDEVGQVLERPSDESLKCSECLSLFMVAFKLRDAGCCIHSHSINANLVTALHSKENLELNPNRFSNNYSEFRITNQEMIKGIKRGSSNENLQYNDVLVVPIIDNVLYERDLAGAMHEAVSKYPEANAVLVRNHGVYVWGKTWKQAKSMAECYDYLFKLKLEAARYKFEWMLEN